MWYQEGLTILLQGFYLSAVCVFKFRISHFVIWDVSNPVFKNCVWVLCLFKCIECRHVLSIIGEDFHLIIHLICLCAVSIFEIRSAAILRL